MRRWFERCSHGGQSARRKSGAKRSRASSPTLRIARAESLEPRALLAGTPTGEFAFSGGFRYFAADDGLYRATDSGETVQLADLIGVARLTDLAGTLFFAADDGVHGLELWRSDGTPAGTQLVADINPGDANANPDHLTALDGALLFSANDGSHGTELWKSDGTPLGTILLTDSHEPDYQVIFATSWAFLTGTQVDGSFIGIRNIGDADLWVNRFANNSDLYSKASGGAPWDGTFLPFKAILSTSTQSARDHAPILGPVYNTQGELVATGDADLWDGSIQNLIYDEAGKSPPGFMVWTGTISDGSFSGASRTDWSAHWSTAVTATIGDWRKTDSTWIVARNTSLGNANLLYGVSPLLPGADLSSDPSDFIVLNHTLYFTAVDPLHGRELWKTDGTAAGTTMVADFYPGTTSSGISNLIIAEGKLYFGATDNVHGLQLWRLDPVTNAVDAFSLPGFGPGGPLFQLTGATNSLYFVRFVNNGGLRGVWRFDLETGAIVQAAYLPFKSGLAGPTVFATLGDRLFFTGESSSGFEIWTTEGTLASAQMVEDLLGSTPQIYLSNPQQLTKVGDRLYFTADDGTHGVELWTTDGTSSGTYLVQDINTQPGPGSSNPDNLVDVNGTFYFTADDGIAGRQLWKIEAGTSIPVNIHDSTPGLPLNAITDLWNVGNRAWFTVTDGAAAPTLWESSDFDTRPLLAATGAATGQVWYDIDGDSLRSAAESPVPDVAVNLLIGNTLWESVLTSADGSYRFSAVPSAAYRVEFTAPAATEFVQPNRRDDDSVDSDADPFTGRAADFSLAVGQTIESIDAGVRTPLAFPWHNPASGFDVNDDDEVVPHDLLLLIDQLNRYGIRELPPPTPGNAPPFYYFDTAPNNFLEPQDILVVIDDINRRALERDGFGLLETGKTSLLASDEQGGDAIAVSLEIARFARPETFAANLRSPSSQAAAVEKPFDDDDRTIAALYPDEDRDWTLFDESDGEADSMPLNAKLVDATLLTMSL